MFMNHVRIAVASLKATRGRTFLTILGVMIGVMAITLVLALGEGAKNAVTKHVSELDDNVLVVRPGYSQRDASTEAIDYNPLSAYAATTLTENDYTTAREIEGVTAVAPLMLVNGSVKNREAVAQKPQIVATSPDLAEVLGLEAKEGQFLDGETARDTVVLGHQLSIDLFGTDQTLGHRVQIRGIDHVVIGVLKKIDNPMGVNGINFNDAAIVGLEAGKGFNQGIAQIQQLTVQTENADRADTVQKTIHEKFLANHNGEEDFTVLTGDEAAQVSHDTMQVIVGMVTAIAAVSLLVGGIGIMNIMLVSVTERVREIGIRKSLGASSGQIMTQFLIEAVIMCIVGGILGFALAYGFAWILSSYLAFDPVFEWYILGIAFLLSMGVGVIFGFFPAYKAAKEDPIRALRQYQ